MAMAPAFKERFTFSSVSKIASTVFARTYISINFQRETFRAEDAIRVHFVMQEGGQTVNTIPSRTQMEMYVRAKTVDAIFGS